MPVVNKSREQRQTEREGVDAFKAGVSEDGCPYPSNQSEGGRRVWWFNGWLSARTVKRLPRLFKLHDLLMAMIVCMAGSVMADEPLPLGDDAPRAVMTLVDSAGQPVVDMIDPGKMIVITTEMSMHDNLDGSLRWRIEGTSQVHVYPDKSAAVIVSELTDGLIRVQLIAAKGGRSDDQVILIRTGKGPQPPPKPVDPIDPVIPPGPVTGLRVLIVYESAANLTREQLNILNSTALIGVLNEKCAKGPDGRAEWRKWDKSSVDKTGLKTESAVWQELWKSVSPKLGTLPQVVIATDQAAVVYPLPATEADALALLAKLNTGGK